MTVIPQKNVKEKKILQQAWNPYFATRRKYSLWLHISLLEPAIPLLRSLG